MSRLVFDFEFVFVSFMVEYEKGTFFSLFFFRLSFFLTYTVMLVMKPFILLILCFSHHE